MAKFIFWNTQRLGAGTGLEKNMALESILAQIFHDFQTDSAFLCEVTSDSKLGDAVFSKEIHYKKKGALGYSSWSPEGDAGALERFPVPKFNELFGHSVHKKGGNEFTRQSKRMVVKAGDVDGVPVYLYHANASARAAFVVSWVAEALRQEEDGNFILVGDLNCEPADFKSEIDKCSGIKDHHKKFRCCSDGSTHNAKTGLIKTYDWAVVGAATPKTVTVQKVNLTGAVLALGLNPTKPTAVLSDHLPIVVTIA